MSRFGIPSSFPVRALALAGALCALSHASPAAVPEPPLRVAVAVPDSLPAACGASLQEPAVFARALAEALADSLGARGVAAVADTTLARWLRRLDATRFPDPRDYGRARDYLAATGARHLVYVNDMRAVPRATEGCGLVFEAALWSTEPLGRKAVRHGEAPDAARAANLLAEWLGAQP